MCGTFLLMASRIWVRLCLLLSSDFHCKGNDGSWVISVYPGLSGHAGLHKQWHRLHEHHNHWWWVLSVRVQPGIHPFPYNENLTWAQHYLTQMVLAINWCYWQLGKNLCMRMKVQGRLMQVCFIEIHQVFAKENNFGYFPNTVVCLFR